MEDILGVYNRFGRQIVLSHIGFEGQERINKGRILIVGLGGIGSPLAMILARMGVGYLKLIDRDIVSIADLHRQFLYTPDDVDRPKAVVAKKRLEHENPGVSIEAYPINITFHILKRIASNVDIIIDALDSMRYRYIVNRVSLYLGKPYIYTAAIGMYGSLMTIFPYKTPCLECVYHGISDDKLPKCSTVGVHPSVTSIIASLAASEAIDILIGRNPNLYSKLLMFDLANLSLSILDVSRNPNCKVCGSTGKLSIHDIKVPEMELLCGRDGSGVYVVNVNEFIKLDIDKVETGVLRMGLSVEKLDDDALKIYIEDGVELVLFLSGVGIFKVYRPVPSPSEYSKRLKKLYLNIVSLSS